MWFFDSASIFVGIGSKCYACLVQISDKIVLVDYFLRSSSAFRFWKYGLTVSSVIISCLMADVDSEVLKLLSSRIFLYSLHHLSCVFKDVPLLIIGYFVGKSKEIGFWKFNFVASSTYFFSPSSVCLLLQ